jgi:ATP-dependent protease HslVU (ClpYQ) ATPase subunit
MLLQIKDTLIPFWDKLPKDSQFYKHYMQNINFSKLKNTADTRAEEDNILFKDAIDKINREHENAERSYSPSGNKKRIPYD